MMFGHSSALDRAFRKLPTVLAFSARSQGPLRPWNDVANPLEFRVHTILEARSIHPADFSDAGVKDLLRRCCKLGSLKGLEMAQSILDRLVVEKRRLQETDKTGHSTYSISQHLFSIVMFGWARAASRERIAECRMRALLDIVLDEGKHDHALYKDELTNGLRVHLPTVEIFNTYLVGLSNAALRKPQAAVNAEATLYEMYSLYEEHGWHTRPTTRVFNAVIDAYANTGHRDSGERALKLLNQMHKINVEKKKEERGDKGFARIVEPDVIACTTVLKALRRSNTPPEQIFAFIRSIHEQGLADMGFYGASLQAVADMVERENSLPVRLALTDEAQRILEYARELFDKGGDTISKRFGESTFLHVYNSLIEVWSRAYCEQAAPTCEDILHEMIREKKVIPNVVSFGACLHGKSKVQFYSQLPQHSMVKGTQVSRRRCSTG